MVLPFFIFWLIVFFTRQDLGWRGVGICIVVWAALLAGLVYLDSYWYVFGSAQAILDCALLIVILKGDVRIW